MADCESCNNGLAYCNTDQRVSAWHSPPSPFDGHTTFKRGDLIDISKSDWEDFLSWLLDAWDEGIYQPSKPRGILQSRIERSPYITAERYNQILETFKLGGGSWGNKVSAGMAISAKHFNDLVQGALEMEYDPAQCDSCNEGCESCNTGLICKDDGCSDTCSNDVSECDYTLSDCHEPCGEYLCPTDGGGCGDCADSPCADCSDTCNDSCGYDTCPHDPGCGEIHV